MSTTHHNAVRPIDPTPTRAGNRVVVARAVNGQPRTYRLPPRTTQEAAYRRLAVAILRLDTETLTARLRAARRGLQVV